MAYISAPLSPGSWVPRQFAKFLAGRRNKQVTTGADLKMNNARRNFLLATGALAGTSLLRRPSFAEDAQQSQNVALEVLHRQAAVVDLADRARDLSELSLSWKC